RLTVSGVVSVGATGACDVELENDRKQPTRAVLWPHCRWTTGAFDRTGKVGAAVAGGESGVAHDLVPVASFGGLSLATNASVYSKEQSPMSERNKPHNGRDTD